MRCMALFYEGGGHVNVNQGMSQNDLMRGMVAKSILLEKAGDEASNDELYQKLMKIDLEGYTDLITQIESSNKDNQNQTLKDWLKGYDEGQNDNENIGITDEYINNQTLIKDLIDNAKRINFENQTAFQNKQVRFNYFDKESNDPSANVNLITTTRAFKQAAKLNTINLISKGLPKGKILNQNVTLVAGKMNTSLVEHNYYKQLLNDYQEHNLQGRISGYTVSRGTDTPHDITNFSSYSTLAKSQRNIYAQSRIYAALARKAELRDKIKKGDLKVEDLGYGNSSNMPEGAFAVLTKELQELQKECVTYQESVDKVMTDLKNDYEPTEQADSVSVSSDPQNTDNAKNEYAEKEIRYINNPDHRQELLESSKTLSEKDFELKMAKYVMAIDPLSDASKQEYAADIARINNEDNIKYASDPRSIDVKQENTESYYNNKKALYEELTGYKETSEMFKSPEPPTGTEQVNNESEIVHTDNPMRSSNPAASPTTPDAPSATHTDQTNKGVLGRFASMFTLGQNQPTANSENTTDDAEMTEVNKNSEAAQAPTGFNVGTSEVSIDSQRREYARDESTVKIEAPAESRKTEYSRFTISRLPNTSDYFLERIRDAKEKEQQKEQKVNLSEVNAQLKGTPPPESKPSN